MSIPTTPGTLDRVRNSKAAIIRRLAATGALALTVLGLGVSAASAGESEVIRVKGGVVKFQAHGEILKAKDTRRDRLGVRARLYVGKPPGLTLMGVVTDRGAGGKAKSKKLNLRDDIPVLLQVCYVDFGNNNVKCSRYEPARS